MNKTMSKLTSEEATPPNLSTCVKQTMLAYLLICVGMSTALAVCPPSYDVIRYIILVTTFVAGTVSILAIIWFACKKRVKGRTLFTIIVLFVLMPVFVHFLGADVFVNH
jgi:hypothetical protein